MLIFGVYVYFIDIYFFFLEVVFVVIFLLNILRFVVNMALWMMFEVVKVFVLLKRFNKFLNNDDIDLDCVLYDFDRGNFDNKSFFLLKIEY